MVEWARLESVCRLKPTEGSNPSLSALPNPPNDSPPYEEKLNSTKID